MIIKAVSASPFLFETIYQSGLERKGVAVQLRTEEFEAVGETFHLEGYTEQTPEQLLKLLPLLRKTLLHQKISLDCARLTGAFSELLAGLPPQLRFAVEMACLRLLAQQAHCTIAGLLEGNPSREIAMTALFDAADPLLFEKVGQAIQRGIRCMKLKVARQTVERDLRIIHALREQLGPEVKLRLDANRKWSIEQAREALQGLKALSIEYIEEPVKDWKTSLQLTLETGVPLALDETIYQQTDLSWQEAAELKAIVVKPFLIGSFEKAAQIARQANRLGAAVIIGTSLESHEGRLFLKEFAKAYQSTSYAGSFEV